MTPLGSTLRKGMEGDTKGALKELAVEGATELLGGGVAAKVAKRVPAGELWVKVENIIEGTLGGQKPGTFVDGVLDSKGGYVKFGNKGTDSFKTPELDRGSLVQSPLQKGLTGTIDTWWGKLLELISPGDPK